MLEDNSVEAADLSPAAAIANLVVPLYPRNGRPAHTHMLGHTNCRALLVSEHHAHEVEGMQLELPDLEHIFVRDANYEDWLAGQSAEDPDVTVAPDDYFIIRHTGGTTGLPKGLLHPQGLACSWARLVLCLSAGGTWRQMFAPWANLPRFRLPVFACGYPVVATSCSTTLKRVMLWM